MDVISKQDWLSSAKSNGMKLRMIADKYDQDLRYVIQPTENQSEGEVVL